MLDRCGREISYLRLSVTDLCNLRCSYCMPACGVEKRPHEDILSVEEITEIVRAAAQLDIHKVRITGGEPLVRRGILDIVRSVVHTDNITEIAITTNGILLPRYAADLRACGLGRINISIDSLHADVYHTLTRGGNLRDALAGLRAAQHAGFDKIKINCVLIQGVNHTEIADFVSLTRDGLNVRFIELMPIGQCADWERERFLPARVVLESVPDLVEQAESDGVARLFRLPGASGSVGLITPLSHAFCDTCNRIRITADGKLKPCLHAAQEIPLRGLRGEALVDALRIGMQGKPQMHCIDSANGTTSQNLRDMYAIGG